MKIALTATGKDLSSDIDPRFGRAQMFLIVDSDTMAVEVVENKQNLDLPQGAGIQAAQTIVEQQAKALITGNCGPKAFRVLKTAGIQVFTNVQGTVDEALKMYKKGSLKSAPEANVEGHWV